MTLKHNKTYLPLIIKTNSQNTDIVIMVHDYDEEQYIHNLGRDIRRKEAIENTKRRNKKKLWKTKQNKTTKFTISTSIR